MSKFKVGDLVYRDCNHGGASGGARWRLKEKDNRGRVGLWLATDERDGVDGIFRDESISGYIEDIAPRHYTSDSTGKDYLARCEDTFSREEMIGAYRFTLGKYVDRMGKKAGEPVEKELAKIIDYATRAKAWLEGE